MYDKSSDACKLSFTSQSILVKIWSLQLLIRFLFLRISFNYPTEYRVALNTTPQPLLSEMTELLTKLLRRKKPSALQKPIPVDSWWIFFSTLRYLYVLRISIRKCYIHLTTAAAFETTKSSRWGSQKHFLLKKWY